jgi:hypothetical protein
LFLLRFIVIVLVRPRSFEPEPSNETIWNQKTRDDDKLNGHINSHGHNNGHISGDSRRKHSGQRADEDALWSRLCFGISTICSLRGIGSLRKAKNVAHFSSTDTSYMPSRAKFLLQGLGISLFACLFLDSASKAAHPESNSVNLAPEKIAVLSALGISIVKR